MASASAALLAGCKGNTTSAAIIDQKTGKPPTLEALPAKAAADPLSGAAWSQAHWTRFTAPIGTSRSTPPTRAAVLYDDRTLYVAFVSELAANETAMDSDAVTIYLDPLAQGKELLDITADRAGMPRVIWTRATGAPEPLGDGTPNFGYPLITMPGVKIGGLGIKVQQSAEGGVPCWTAVISIPLASLPAPLQMSPSEGREWKMNLLRTMTVQGEQVQSNASPIYAGTQAYMPQRMGHLKFLP